MRFLPKGLFLFFLSAFAATGVPATPVAAFISAEAVNNKSYRQDLTSYTVEQAVAQAVTIVIARRKGKIDGATFADKPGIFKFEVIEILKGDAPKSIDVQTPGATMPFAPQVKQNYLLFLLSGTKVGCQQTYIPMSHNLTTALAFPITDKGNLVGRKPSTPDWQKLTVDQVRKIITP